MAFDSHSPPPAYGFRAMLRDLARSLRPAGAGSDGTRAGRTLLERAACTARGAALAARERAEAIAAMPRVAPLARAAVRTADALTRAGQTLAQSPPARFLTASIGRRIIVGNLIGLAVLIFGILALNQHQEWLIAAKRDSLRIQGEIIAAAIAASASIDTDRLTFEPDRLPEVEGARLPYRDDAFAALELSLRPDRVGPVLRRLIQSAHNTRARIYDREGELLVDSHRPSGRTEAPTGERIRVKTTWTRLLAFFDASELPIYREIGSANGTYYPEVREALKGRAPPPALLLNERDKQIVSLAVPIQRRNSTLGALLLSTRPGEIDDVLAKERRIIFSLGALALLTTILTSLMLNRTIAGPVRRLSDAAEQVSQSITARADLPDYSARRDEVGQMGKAFRRMTEALYRRIESSEKFAADVAHELRNPLTAARATAETMAYVRTEAERGELVKQIQGELQRLNRLITDVSNASRLDAELARQKKEPVDVGAVALRIAEVLGDLAEADGIKITAEVKPGDTPSALVIPGHEGRVDQVITNLVDNAVSFSKAGQTVSVRIRRIGAEVEIVVDDDGPGMPDNKLEAIFDRFYSDRPESDRTRGKNSGLGLSISREIVLAHNGRIWAENRRDPTAGARGPVLGARFVVRLPAEAALGARSAGGHVRR